MLSPRHALAPVAMLALGGLLTGCGSKTIDPKPIQNQISGFQPAKDAGWVATDAHCPSGQKAKAGTSFNCTVKFNGILVTFKATVDSVASNSAHITTEASPPIFDIKKSADQLAQQAGAGWTADCGAPIQQLATGAEITCTLTNGSQTQPVKVKVDSSGQLVVEGPSDTSTTAPADTTTVAPAAGGDTTTTAG